MKRWSLILQLSVMALVMATAKVRAEDPLKVGPDVYKLTFENDRVRVLTVTFKPGAKIGMHSHPDHFAYALTDGSLKITGADGKVTDAKATAGQLFWFDAQSHMAENTGTTEFRLLVTELKEPKHMMKKKMDAGKPAEAPKK